MTFAGLGNPEERAAVIALFEQPGFERCRCQHLLLLMPRLHLLTPLRHPLDGAAPAAAPATDAAAAPAPAAAPAK